MKIQDIIKKYNKKIDPLDLELLIAFALKKPREFVLAHPETPITPKQLLRIDNYIDRRAKEEPLAYILGQKEFYRLNFKVNESTLIPRPETELMVTELLNLNPKNATIIDVGTGSGNIIISLAKNLTGKNKLIALDISKKALAIAKQNAKIYNVDKKIKFFKSDLLMLMLTSKKYKPANKKLLIVANLPYLSQKIYGDAPASVRKFEPRLALLSRTNGLAHYKKLLMQIRSLKSQFSSLHVSCFMEISPEQKTNLCNILGNLFPNEKAMCHRDLTGRWRICQISLN